MQRIEFTEVPLWINLPLPENQLKTTRTADWLMKARIYKLIHKK